MTSYRLNIILKDYNMHILEIKDVFYLKNWLGNTLAASYNLSELEESIIENVQ